MKVIKFVFIGLFQLIVFIILLILSSLLSSLLAKLLISIGLGSILNFLSHNTLGETLSTWPSILSIVGTYFISKAIFKEEDYNLGVRFFSIILFVLGLYGIITGIGKRNIMGSVLFVFYSIILFKSSFDRDDETNALSDENDNNEQNDNEEIEL